MNKQGPGKIGWTDYTWNPIRGLCPVGCWYCYARKIYKRFKLDPTIRYVFNEPESRDYIERLQRFNPKPESKIFICSTFELFHPVVEKKWRDEIFQIIEMNSKYTFQILTKMPENIDRPMPDNVWLGVSVTKDSDFQRLRILKNNTSSRIKFVSFEPLLERLSAPTILMCRHFNWAIFGRLTRCGNKYNPKRKWLQTEVDYLQSIKIPIFLKENLRGIWGDDLIQEWPTVLERAG